MFSCILFLAQKEITLTLKLWNIMANQRPSSCKTYWGTYLVPQNIQYKDKILVSKQVYQNLALVTKEQILEGCPWSGQQHKWLLELCSTNLWLWPLDQRAMDGISRGTNYIYPWSELFFCTNHQVQLNSNLSTPELQQEMVLFPLLPLSGSDRWLHPPVVIIA